MDFPPLTVHSWHVSASSSLRFVKKIKWLYIRGMWFLLIATLYGRLTDCAFFAYHYLFIVTFHEKISLTVHYWHVITSSSFPFAKRIDCLFIVTFRKKGLIDCAFLACDYLFIFAFREKDSLTVYSSLCLNSRNGSIDCAPLACDYPFIVTFREKD